MNKSFNSVRYAGAFNVEGADRARFQTILQWIGQGHRVLDIGGGDGFMSDAIRELGNQTAMIEVAENAIKRAREKGLEVFDLDLNTDWAEQFQNRRFDLVLAGEIIEHIFDTDRFLRNIHQCLEDDGRLILTTPNIASFGRRAMLALGINPLIETTARAKDAGHIRYFTFDALKRLLEENRFHVKRRSSDSINFDNQGKWKSDLAARILPALGRTIIVECAKQKKHPLERTDES